MNWILARYVRRLFKQGTLRITDARGRVHAFGDGSAPVVHLRLNDPGAERAIALNPPLMLGQCYMDKRLDVIEGDIFDFLKMVFENVAILDVASMPWMVAMDRVRLVWRRIVQNNTPRRARRNVAHHYDLSEAFYALFLDEDRQYSCAYFETPEATLDEAQRAKKRHLAAKLVFDRPGLRTLDIGCGWGGLGLYLAEHCGARVDGVTLSTEQHGVAVRRAEAAGLQETARFELKDYRAAAGPYDRLVSVGMFEHVGRDFYDAYFAKCAELLDRDGIALIHTIGRHMAPRNTNSFMARHIFPGGYIPSLSEVMPSIEKAGLIVTDVEILRLHYAETLKHWRLRFSARRAEAQALTDERFCRMWEFYLAASECAFRWQDLVVFQIQLAKRHGVVPTTRAYVEAAEDALRARETTGSRADGERQAAE